MSTVAIIEDNASNMKLMKSILEKSGYTILSAMDAKIGIELIFKNLPDIIIMDIHMPGINGIEAIEILKAYPETRNIPVIAVTAKAMDGDRDMILASGCDGYASKPIRYKDLLKMIENFINKNLNELN